MHITPFVSLITITLPGPSLCTSAGTSGPPLSFWAARYIWCAYACALVVVNDVISGRDEDITIQGSTARYYAEEIEPRSSMTVGGAIEYTWHMMCEMSSQEAYTRTELMSVPGLN